VDATISRLHCAYRAPGAPAWGRDLARRFDRVAKGHLRQALEAALAKRLGDEGEHHRLDRLRVRCALRVTPGFSDDELARRWAAELAAAVHRAVRTEDGEAAEPDEPAGDMSSAQDIPPESGSRPSREEIRTWGRLARSLARDLGLIDRGAALTEEHLARLETAVPATDWRQPATLADALARALGVLLAERVVVAPDASSDDLDARLETALDDGWHWVDREHLRERLAPEAPHEKDDRGSREPSQEVTPTMSHPRSHALQDHLRALVAEGDLELDPSHPTSGANARLLYRRLVERHPRWQSEGRARRLIAYLLSAWSRGRPIPGLPRLTSPSPHPRPVRSPATAVATAASTAPSLERDLSRRLSSVEGLETECAGVFLLLRGVLDLRLPELAERVGFPVALPSPTDPSPTRTLLLALGVAWGGPAAIRDGGLDPGLAWLGGWDPAPAVDELRSGWTPAEPGARTELVEALHRTLERRRLPETCAAETLKAELEALDLRAIAPEEDAAALSLGAAAALRAWAHWLRGFHRSSIPFLLESFIRRGGRLRLEEPRLPYDPPTLEVELDPGPIDVVAQMAGYFDELEPLPWLGGRRVRFRVTS